MEGGSGSSSGSSSSQEVMPTDKAQAIAAPISNFLDSLKFLIFNKLVSVRIFNCCKGAPALLAPTFVGVIKLLC
jgi:hypothetical protein